MSDALRFVITGCARSGTGFTATLFDELGVECGHEALFTPYTERFAGFGEHRGDSSWLAVPFVDELPPGTVVLHQVRHPDAVVASLLGIRFFADDATEPRRDLRSRVQVARARGARALATSLMTREGRSRARRRRSDFVAFVRRHCPEIFAEADEFARAGRYWVSWNRAAGRAANRDDLVYLRYRVEDLDVEHAARLLDAVGAHIPEASIAQALERLGRDTNTRPARGSTRSSGRSVRALPGMTDLADSYGYNLGEG